MIGQMMSPQYPLLGPLRAAWPPWQWRRVRVSLADGWGPARRTARHCPAAAVGAQHRGGPAAEPPLSRRFGSGCTRHRAASGIRRRRRPVRRKTLPEALVDVVSPRIDGRLHQGNSAADEHITSEGVGNTEGHAEVQRGSWHSGRRADIVDSCRSGCAHTFPLTADPLQGAFTCAAQATQP